MRKVIFGINLTMDGCCDHTKFSGDDDMMKHFTEFFRDVDLIIYGRKTYELMIPYWPEVAASLSGTKAENEYAQVFDAIDKIVFSKTLSKVDDKNTRLLHTDLIEEITRLKQTEGRNIAVGGVDLPSQLLAYGLIDEFHIVVHPVIAGAGRRLFDGTILQEVSGLKLATSKVLESGCVALHYLKQ